MHIHISSGHDRRTRNRRRTRRGAPVLVVLALFLASVLDPAAVDRDPEHTHVVVGGTPAEQARALAAHTQRAHASEMLHRRLPGEQTARDARTPWARATGEESAGAIVLSVRSGEASASSVVGLTGGGLVATATGAFRVSPAVAPLEPARMLMSSGTTPSIPDPPPRAL
jgi:hypothetical protein